MGLEIERKYLVTVLPDPLPRPQIICQGYLSDRPERVIRIRSIDQSAWITIKGKTVGTRRLEFEYPIPAEEARQMLEFLCLRPLIEKKRFTVTHEGFEWTIDLFQGENQGLVLAEIELAAEDQAFPLPPWAGQEVSRDPRYFNSNLVDAPFSTW